MAHAIQPMHKLEPGLTKIRDTVTLFNLLKRDQGHVFSTFSISNGSICRVTKHDFQTKVLSGSVLPNVPYGAPYRSFIVENCL